MKSSHLEKPPVANLRSFGADELVRIDVITFTGDEIEIDAVGAEVRTESIFERTLASLEIGYKSVKSFTIHGFDGTELTYYRKRKGAVWIKKLNTK